MKRLLGTLALAGLAITVATAVRADDEGGGNGGGGSGEGGAVAPPDAGGSSGGSSRGSSRGSAGRARGRGDPTAGGAVFAANCARCHGGDGSGGSGGPNVRRASAGSLLSAMREGEDGMPTFPGIGRQGARDISAYLRGVAASPAPAPSPSPSPPSPSTPPASAPKWAQVQAVMSQNCAACHTGTKASAGVRLDSYGNVVANASRAMAAVDAGRMPLGRTMTSAQVQTLRDWIAAGTPK